MNADSIQQAVAKAKLLPPRQRQVAVAVTDGKLQKEIADELKISLSTVNNVLQQIYDKLNVHNRVELTRIVLKAGLTE